MSEYQYYEFQAVDRPLDQAAQDALRAISSRARITASRFTNHYEWGDLKGDPRAFMERWFDLHLYFTGWGPRRLMMRVPRRFLDRADIEPFLRDVDWVKVSTSKDNILVDIHRQEAESDDDGDDGSGWLAALAPLRADVLSGDHRLFYLLWLAAVQDEQVADDAVEPLPGIGPLTGPLGTFATFCQIDGDLVQSAAESGAADAAMSDGLRRDAVAAIAENEKTDLLLRLVDGDNLVAAELRRRIREHQAVPATPHRTVRILRARAQAIRAARERAEAKRDEAARRRQAAAADRARRARIEILRQRGDSVWREIDDEIERRIAPGYDKAASLLADLQALAVEEGSQGAFARRLASLRAQHERKRTFIERLAGLG